MCKKSHWARGQRGIWFSENQPLAVTCSHSSDRKWPQVTAESKWPQVTASDRRETAERPQVTAESKWPQVTASGRKWPQVTASSVQSHLSTVERPQVTNDSSGHGKCAAFSGSAYGKCSAFSGRQQYHREAFFQASYSKERGCTSKTRRRISRKQRRQFLYWYSNSPIPLNQDCCLVGPPSEQ